MTAEGRLVVDANIAAKWFLNEEHRQEARRLLRRPVGQLVAPDFLIIELGNIFVKKIRTGSMTEANARRALASVPQRLDLLATSHLPLATLSIALQHSRSFYDALYVALALEEGCQFVTADERMYSALNLELPETVLWVGNLQAA